MKRRKTKIIKFDHNLLSQVFDNRDFILSFLNDNRDFILSFLNDNLQDIIEEGLGAFGIENDQPPLTPYSLSYIAKDYISNKLKSSTNTKTLADALAKATKNPLQHLKNTTTGIKTDISNLINKNLTKLSNPLKERF
jgi:hypothetical protein